MSELPDPNDRLREHFERRARKRELDFAQERALCEERHRAGLAQRHAEHAAVQAILPAYYDKVAPSQRLGAWKGSLEDGYTEREQRAEAQRDTREHRTRLGLFDFDRERDDPEDPYAS